MSAAPETTYEAPSPDSAQRSGASSNDMDVTSMLLSRHECGIHVAEEGGSRLGGVPEGASEADVTEIMTAEKALRAPSAAGEDARRKWRWVAFGTVVTAAAMDLLDSTIAQVAAPTIRNELGGSYAVIEWVTAAYALAMAVGLLTGGRLGDIFGRRQMLLAGMAGFVLASAACAAAQNAAELIGARAVQGLLGAVMLPQVVGLIRDMFAAHEMGKAFGVYGPVMGLSAMLGPIASGGLISLDVLGSGWRAIFAVNVPVGLAALVLGFRTLPKAASAGASTGSSAGASTGSSTGSGAGGTRRGRLDLPGALLAGVAMFGLVFPLAQGHSLGWPAWLFAMMAGAVLALAGFGWYQVRRQDRKSTRLNSSHMSISYAVFCLKKKKHTIRE